MGPFKNYAGVDALDSPYFEDGIAAAGAHGTFVDNNNPVGLGSGNDLYVLQTANFTINDTGGTDRVAAFDNINLADSRLSTIENVEVFNEVPPSNPQFRFAAGDADPNIVSGRGHIDIYGGGGDDVLIGGTGRQVFVLGPNDGNDVIYSFTPGEDALRFTGGITQAQVLAGMSQGESVAIPGGGTGVKIDLASSHLYIHDVTRSQLLATNYATGAAPIQAAFDPSLRGQLTFNDEFNTQQLSMYDPYSAPAGKWNVTFGYDGDKQNINANTIPSNQEAQIYVSPYFRQEPGQAQYTGESPFSMDGQALTITAKPFSNPENFINSDGQPYRFSSGEINTFGTFSQTYGYFEMAATIPQHVGGAWPAFWLLSEDSKWPPEIDILEAGDGRSDVALTTRHTDPTNGLGANDSLGSGAFIPPVADGLFHTYGLLWDPQHLTWYVDGAEVFQTNTSDDMHKPMFMIANMAVGGVIGGAVAADMTAQMKIDYIRAYELNPNLGSTPELNFSTTGVTHQEGNSGLTTYTFQVDRVGSAAAASTVHWSVTPTGPSNELMAEAADFGGAFPQGDLTIPAGASSRTFTVDVAGDTSVEGNEMFAVTLSSPTNGALGGASRAIGTIANDDGLSASTLAFSSAPLERGEGGPGTTSAFTFTVTRLGSTTGTASANWTVSPGDYHPASAQDFQGGALPSGVVNFVAGQVNSTITVNVAGDSTVEDNEGFKVSLSSPVGASLAAEPAYGWIMDSGAAGGGTGGGSSGGETRTGNDAGPQTLQGGAGDDVLAPAHQADTLTGGAGADTFRFDVTPWNPGRITDFGNGADVIDLRGLFQQSGVTYTGGDPFEQHYLSVTLSGGDTVIKFDSDADATGTQWASTITTVVGKTPAQVEAALQVPGGGTGSGGQTQSGTDSGPHTLQGGAGDDLLIAGHQADTLTGGAGADTFRFDVSPWNPGQITDFSTSSDTIDLRGLFSQSGVTYSSGNPFNLGYLILENQGANTIIKFDPDAGANGNPWPITITTVQNVTIDALKPHLLAPGASGGNPGITYQGGDSAGAFPGTAGDDTITAGRAGDELVGGAGRDTFAFAQLPWNSSTIHDFTRGEDHLDFRQIFQNTAPGYSGTDPVADHYLSLSVTQSGDTVVTFDQDGSASGNPWPFTLAVLDGVSTPLTAGVDWIFR